MTSTDLRQKYLNFFKNKGHAIMPSSPLVPENDPTTLFTGSGMQPMVPYLLGQPHPMGDKIVDSQKCFRSQDIEEVGDNRHTTMFEMLGNWSLGDYFKKEQLTYFFEFLTKEVGLDPEKLYITVFSGDEKNNIPKDTESVEIWKQLFSDVDIDAKDIELVTEKQGYQKGMQEGRIFYYDARKNWWSRAGTPENMPADEPGGPDSEVFYDFGTPHDKKFGENCHPNCDCGRFLEIGNSVFMQYKKIGETLFEPLPQNNVDFGGGLERILMAVNNEPDMFKNDLHWPIIEEVCFDLKINYGQDKKITSSLRIIADHLKAAVFLIKDGVLPSNKLQGYFLRRLLRRTAVKLTLIKTGAMGTLSNYVDKILDIYEKTDYFNGEPGRYQIKQIIDEEIDKFRKTLDKGLKEISKITKVNGKVAFDLYQTYGFPLEITIELFQEKGQQIDLKEFEQEFNKHKELSRSASAGMFKGGLADHSQETTRLHTATHLLHQALRTVLGEHVQQKGSNITVERLRFDFSHPEKLTNEQIKQVEELINQKISQQLPVNNIVLDKDEALKSKALHFFGDKYGDKVSIYYIGDSLETAFSKEFCGGPHVSNTSEIKGIKITKEESAGSGIRRIYATLV